MTEQMKTAFYKCHLNLFHYNVVHEQDTKLFKVRALLTSHPLYYSSKQQPKIFFCLVIIFMFLSNTHHIVILKFPVLITSTNVLCLNENGPHRPIYVTAWPLVGGTVWEGLGVALVCH